MAAAQHAGMLSRIVGTRAPSHWLQNTRLCPIFSMYPWATIELPPVIIIFSNRADAAVRVTKKIAVRNFQHLTPTISYFA
jgi:hypothetical protein